MSTAIADAAADAAVRQIIDAKRAMPGALLPILHDIQHALGHIPADAVPLVADALNLSRAEVHGVISYYHHFRDKPAGRHVVQVCRAEACQARGADALVAHAKAVLGCDFHHTSADGAVTLEQVFCLGHCAVGPNIAIDDALFARVSPQRFDQLMAAKRGEK